MENFGLGAESWLKVEQYPIPTEAQTPVDFWKKAKVRHLCPIRGQNDPGTVKMPRKEIIIALQAQKHLLNLLRNAAHSFDLELWKSANSPKA
jgi:hypothetical protein